jgi:NADH-quinone oxidoreductase subunit L
MNINFLSCAWLIPIIPILSGFLTFISKNFVSTKLSRFFSTSSIGFAAILTYFISFQYILSENIETTVINKIEWLKYGHNLRIDLGVLLDPLSVLLMIVVCTISFLVHVYSMGYMPEDKSSSRFFIYLDFFTASMLGLVVSINIIQSFFFWELMGCFSFLLISFYYHKKSARSAAKKAFIITRFADFGFLLGILIIGYINYNNSNELVNLININNDKYIPSTNLFAFEFINNPIVIEFFRHHSFMYFGINILTIASGLILMGAFGKSAMFPLHVWLPDAMEGPTPVSALIHAATMVVAGLFIIGRLINIFVISDSLMNFIMYVGTITSLMGAVIACVQNEIKKILAFSTISQLGYMMLALGTTSQDNFIGYSACMFHLFTHAFFKALLFLGAGAIINISGTNNIWHMDSNVLNKRSLMKYLYLIATLAISGIPPFAGFYSKDHIFLAVLNTGNNFIFLICVCTALLTSFYMFRLFFVVFMMTDKEKNVVNVAPNSSISTYMYFPMIVLSLLSIFAGFIRVDSFLITDTGHHDDNYTIMLYSIFVSSSGLLISMYIYLFKYKEFFKYTSQSSIIQLIQKSLMNRLYIDLIYVFWAKQIMFNIISRCIALFDKKIVDGTVDLVGVITCRMGDSILFLHTSQLQTYTLWFMVGFISFFTTLV